MTRVKFYAVLGIAQIIQESCISAQNTTRSEAVYRCDCMGKFN